MKCNVILIIGWRGNARGHAPENLYTGLDGIKASEAAAKAQRSSNYVRILKVTNPGGIPLPVVPHVQKPKAPTPPAASPAAAIGPVKPKAKQDDKGEDSIESRS